MFIFSCSVASFYNSFNYSYWSLAGCVGGCLNSGWCGCVCLNHWNNKCMLSSLYVPGPQVIWWVTTGNQRRYVCVYPDCLPVNISLKIISLSPLSALRLSGWWSSVVTVHTHSWPLSSLLPPHLSLGTMFVRQVLATSIISLCNWQFIILLKLLCL